MVFERLLMILAIVAYLALISMPGIGITYLGWKLSRNMRPILVQTIFRAGLIAFAITLKSFVPSTCRSMCGKEIVGPALRAARGQCKGRLGTATSVT
jgi:hypothetical protein